MTHTIQIIPTHTGIGLTASVIGLFYAFHQQGVKVTYYKPVDQIDSYAHHILQGLSEKPLATPIEASRAEKLLSEKKIDVLLEEIIVTYEKLKADNQVVIIDGLLETKQQPYATELNQMIVKAIGADVVLATDTSGVESLSQFEHRLEFTAANFGGTNDSRVLGAIINRVDQNPKLSLDDIKKSAIFTEQFRLLAAVPHNPALHYPRTIDAVRFLNGEVIYQGDADTLRITDYAMIARTIPNAVDYLSAGNLVITPSDRDDVIMATVLAAAGGHKIAGLILTGKTKPTPQVMKLCQPHIESSRLPILQVDIDSWEIAKHMDNFNLHMPYDDEERCVKTMEYFAECIDADWSKDYIDSQIMTRLSPAAFKYQIVKTAQAAKKVIVLPEGDEPRTVVAANNCVNRGIADCLLLANPDTVNAVAQTQGISLNPALKILDPENIREKYVPRLVELRSKKGMTEELAKTQLEDNVMLGTMMLEAGEVHGLVSGAVHTTANTIRPPLQIIKTAPNSKLVSSIFFMCLPEQVLVYGDCAINPNPNSEQLAEIAIQSADSAAAFGLEPRVAMLSYSTGTSGAGEDVERVREATEIVKQKRPDILIDGPLQYDAATIESVAEKKAPDSLVAGKANVFIFPDLNTGNTTYKAVQRSANAISIGPMLQGMRMPVNDLSRGALIDDIIYTIAVTAVQAKQAEQQ